MPDSNLQDTIFAELKNRPGGMSEYELIRELENNSTVFENLSAESSSLGLFQKHFIVMHALYSLQQTLMQEQQYLSISPLQIVLEKLCVDVDTATTLPAQNVDTELRSYYLDWSNFETTDEGAVDKLLAGFWARYLAADKRLASLEALSLPADANWSDVKLAYRRLAAKHHPDKGGDPDKFRLIREAYENLSDCLPASFQR